MWNLEDETLYIRVHSFALPKAFTYADTRPGHTDREKREQIRAAASRGFPQSIPEVRWWAFRILVQKTGNRPFDIENVPKLVIDAFSKRQIKLDNSAYGKVGLYDDDTIDYVRFIQIGGERGPRDSMIVEIFGRK